MEYTVAIVGGGAGGMAAAITAAKLQHKVLLIERNDVVGKKILATGNGKCNFSNRNMKTDCFYTDDYKKLDKILKEKYGVDDRTIVFENGKPFLKNKEKQFSISHTGEYVALCFSDKCCGIDIEKIVPRNFEKIAKRLNFKVNTLEDFYYAWTKYEAEYKLGHNANKTLVQENDGYIVTAVN